MGIRCNVCNDLGGIVGARCGNGCGGTMRETHDSSATQSLESRARDLELRLQSKHTALKIAVAQRDALSGALDELEQRWLDEAEAMRARGDLSGADERSRCADELADLEKKLRPSMSLAGHRVMVPASVVSCERRPPGWLVTLSCGCVFANLVGAMDTGMVTHHACDQKDGRAAHVPI